MDHKNEEFMRSIKLLVSFWDVQKNIIRFSQRIATKYGLSGPQYSILMIIAPLKQMTQKNLGEKTFFPKSTLSNAVDGLVQEGYMTRQHVEGNRRETLLALSEKGVDLLKKIHHDEDSVPQIFKGALESLTDEQYEELLKMHHDIATYLEAQQ